MAGEPSRPKPGAGPSRRRHAAHRNRLGVAGQCAAIPGRRLVGGDGPNPIVGRAAPEAQRRRPGRRPDRGRLLHLEQYAPAGASGPAFVAGHRTPNGPARSRAPARPGPPGGNCLVRRNVSGGPAADRAADNRRRTHFSGVIEPAPEGPPS